jgi:hypothetical protein
MSIRKFYITKGDQVVFFDGYRHRCLGHVASVMNEQLAIQSAIVREAQAWWRAEFASDIPQVSASGVGD